MDQISLAVAVISPELRMLDAYGASFGTHPRVHNLWTVNTYPIAGQLEPLAAPTALILFLDYADPIRARAVAAELDRAFPNVVVIAIHPRKHELDLLDLMKIGIREVVSEVVPGPEAMEAFDRVLKKLLRDSGEDSGAPVFAFLPARPGCGATTVAVHAAAAAARVGPQKTLLIDFDLRLGLTSFLLKLNGERSVLDALGMNERLDDTIWESLVHRRGLLEVLGSAPVDFRYEHPETHAAELLHYVRQRYQAVCVDLPGELRDHEVLTLRQAQEIFLVSTPDMGALHLARRKAEALRVLDVLPRVSLIINRSNLKSGARMSIAQIEDLLETPVRVTLPMAESEIAEATREAGLVDARSPFGRQIELLSARISGNARKSAKEPRGRSFIDFFSVSQVRDVRPW